MSNTLTDILPKLLAKGMYSLRTEALATRLVNLDYSAEAAKKGSTIDVPIAQAIAASDVTPAAVPPTPGDTVTDTVQISLNNWKKTNFHLTDEELTYILTDKTFVPQQMSEAFQGLASAINQDVWAEYPGVYGYTGTAGTTPFGTVAGATDSRKVLNSQRAPKRNRRGLLDWDAEAKALTLAAFSDAEKVGSSDVKINGEIGRKFGIDWYADDDVPSHTTGAAGTWLVDQADVAIGDTGIHCDGATTTASVGDIFTVAGDTQTYVILTSGALATTDVDITFAPAAKVAWADNAAMTFKATHDVNLVFHRDAFALAMRAPDMGLKQYYNPENSFTMADPVTGLVMRLELIREYKQIVWEIDAMWGAKLIEPKLAMRLAG